MNFKWPHWHKWKPKRAWGMFTNGFECECGKQKLKGISPLWDLREEAYEWLS